MKFHITASVVTALAFCTSRHVFAAFAPSRNHVPAVASPKPFATVPMSRTSMTSMFMTPGNSTSSPLEKNQRQETSVKKSLDTESFANKMDEELETLNQKIKEMDPTMDAYSKALEKEKDAYTTAMRSMSTSDTKAEAKQTTTLADQGLGEQPPMKSKVASSRAEEVAATFEKALEDLYKEEAKVTSSSSSVVPPPVAESKPKNTPHDLIQKVKKAKEAAAASSSTVKNQDDTVSSVDTEPVPMEGKVISTPKEEKPKMERPLTPAEQMAQVSKTILSQPKPEVKKEEPKIKAVTPAQQIAEASKKINIQPEAKQVVTNPPKVETTAVTPAAITADKVETKQETKPVVETVSVSKKVAESKPVVQVPTAKVTPTAGTTKSEIPKSKEVASKFMPPKMDQFLAKINSEQTKDLVSKGANSIRESFAALNTQQNKDFVSKGVNVIMESFATVGKVGIDLVKEVKASLNSTMVEEMDITYEEALLKMSSSFKGFVKICSILGDAVKDVAVELKNSKASMPVKDRMQQRNVKNVIKRASLRIEGALQSMLEEEGEATPSVVEESVAGNKNAPYLDQASTLFGGILSSAAAKVEEVTARTKGKSEEETVVIKEIPVAVNDGKKSTLIQDLLSKTEMDALISSVFEDVAAKANVSGDKLQAAMKEFKKEAGHRPVDIESSPLENLKSTASSLFDGIKSTASSVTAKVNLQKKTDEKPTATKAKSMFSFWNKNNN